MLFYFEGISKWHAVQVILSNFTELKHLVLFDNPILVENRLDKALLQETIGARDLKVYLDKANGDEASIRSKIEAELESTRSKHANEAIHT